MLPFLIRQTNIKYGFLMFVYFSALQNVIAQKDTLQNKSYKELYGFYLQRYQKDTASAKVLARKYLTLAKENKDISKIVDGYHLQLYISPYLTKLIYHDSIIKRLPASSR